MNNKQYESNHWLEKMNTKMRCLGRIVIFSPKRPFLKLRFAFVQQILYLTFEHHFDNLQDYSNVQMNVNDGI